PSSQTWAPFGRATSADDGYADLRATAPAVGDWVVAARVAVGQRYSSGWRNLQLAVRPAGQRLVVTDIDWTIAQSNFDDYFLGSSADVLPVRGSVQALRDISADATIVYLTARDDWFYNKTRAWLDYWHFPKGTLICSDGLTMFKTGGPTARFKAEEIAKLRRLFPDVRAGF